MHSTAIEQIIRSRRPSSWPNGFSQKPEIIGVADNLRSLIGDTSPVPNPLFLEFFDLAEYPVVCPL
jgi:hypothetical protein